MARPRDRALRWAGPVLGLLLAWPALASGPRVELRGAAARTEVAGEGVYLWLQPNLMVDFEVRGPVRVGLRVRQVLSEGREPLPVDLTVVRDDQEQGTVRFRTPPTDGARAAGLGALSGPLVVRLDVPDGLHVYRVLVSGGGQGILVQPWLGDLEIASVVATPGQAEVLKPRPQPRPRPAPPRVPRAEPAEELPGIVMVPGDEGPPALSRRILHAPQAPPPPHGRAFWLSGSLALVLLAGGTGCMAAGGLEAARAGSEPVQLEARRHLDQADQAYLAGGVLYGLGATAALLALVFYLTGEEPGATPALAPGPGGPGLRF